MPTHSPRYLKICVYNQSKLQMSKMCVSLQMERYNRVYMYIYDFKYLEGYTTGSSACPQGGGRLFNSLPFDSFGFCIMCTVAFLIKKIKMHLVSGGEATVKSSEALHIQLL